MGIAVLHVANLDSRLNSHVMQIQDALYQRDSELRTMMTS